MKHQDGVKVSKKCPRCEWRLFDKVSPAKGYIEIKCPHCGAVVKVNLAYRRAAVKYRMARVRIIA